MVGHDEPAHLVSVVKACPRPGCLSPFVKWCYYNNRQRSQPRYLCLGCKKHFTFGGKFRLSKGCKEHISFGGKIGQSKDKKQAASREEHPGGDAVKGLRIKITPAESADSSNLRPVKELRFMMEFPKRNKTSSPDDHSVQSASPISTPKRMLGGRGPFALSNGSAISAPDSSSDEKYQVDAASADMNSPLPHSNGNAISVLDSSSVQVYQVDAGADMNSSAEFEELFVGFEEMVGELVEMFGGSELVALERNLDDDVGLGSGAGAPDEPQLGAVEGGSPAFSWTTSEQLRDPIVRSAGPSGPELLDDEELLLVDSGLSSSLTPWVDISTDDYSG